MFGSSSVGTRPLAGTAYATNQVIVRLAY